MGVQESSSLKESVKIVSKNIMSYSQAFIKFRAFGDGIQYFDS